jgi:tetratricopeptide (TPR) repeat protein
MDGPRIPRPWVLILAALVTVLVAHAPAVEGSFIWDDHQVVIGSPLVMSQPSFWEFFNTAFFSNQELEPGGRGYFRPLTVLTWAVDYAVHDTNASGYHITNLLLHVLNAWLLLSLIRQTGASVQTASVAAALWGLMPRLTEAVSWISGRTDTLAASFVLGALVLASSPAWWRRVAASVLILAGLLSKEVALAGVAALLWLELRRTTIPLKTRLLGCLPLVSVCAVYALLRLRAIGAPGYSMPLGSRRVTAPFEAIGRYLVAILDPWHPHTQNGRLLGVNWTYVALGAVAAVAVGIIAWRFRRRERHELEGAALVMTAASIGLVLHLVPIAVNIVAADRFLYLPLAGLALAFARPLALVLSRVRPPLRIAALAALAVSLGFCTFRRARAWTDEVEFWTFAYAEDRVNNGTATIELGNIFFRAGLHLHALGVYHAYHDEGGVNYGIIGNNMATTLQSLGQYRAARHVLRQVVQRNPDIPKFHFNLALAELSVGNFEAARAALATTLRLLPDHRLAPIVRERIPRLEQEHGKLTGETMPDLLTRSRHAIEVARTKEAVDLTLKAIAQGTPSRADAEGALHFVGKFGDPNAFHSVFRSYKKALGGATPPAVEEAYRMRQAASQRLLALWPSLGFALPEL